MHIRIPQCDKCRVPVEKCIKHGPFTEYTLCVVHRSEKLPTIGGSLYCRLCMLDYLDKMGGK